MLRRALIHLVMMAGVLAFAGLFILLFGNSLDVSCIRLPGQNAVCTFSKALLGQIPVSTRTVADVVDVEKDRSCDGDCSYRALLVTSSGQKVPANEVFTDQGPVLKQMAEIRTFLDGTTSTYGYRQDVPWWVVFLSGGLGLMGLVLVGISFVTGPRKPQISE